MTAPVSTNNETVVRNTSGGTRFFGFLPPHGRRLENGEEYTFPGDLEALLTPSVKRRQRDSYLRALGSGHLQLLKVPSPVYFDAVLDAGLRMIVDDGVVIVDVPAATPPTGSVFSVIAHPDYTAVDADHLVPAGNGDKVRWVKDAVSGAWMEQATVSYQPTLRAGNGGLWGLDFDRSNAQHINILQVVKSLTRNKSGVTVGMSTYRSESFSGLQVPLYISTGASAGSSRVSAREVVSPGGTSQVTMFLRRVDGGLSESSTSSGTVPYPGWRSFLYRIDYANALHYTFAGGVGMADTFPGAAFSQEVAGLTSDTDSLAATLGSDSVLASPWGGILRELHLFDTALSYGDFTALDQRLRAAGI